MQLLDPANHEPILDASWSSAAARDGIAAIVDDALTHRKNLLWPFHPDDEDPKELNPGQASCVYFGGAGVALAIHWLSRNAATPELDDVDETCERIRKAHALEPEMEANHPSWQLGTSGVEGTIAALTGAPLDSTITELKRAIENPTHDPLTGAGNALCALVALHSKHPENNEVVELFRAGVASELAALQTSPDGCEMWLVDLYGRDLWLTGAGHGAAGNLQPMLAGASLLDDETNRQVVDVARDVLRTTAVRSNGFVNWKVGGSYDYADRVQWCHGAPGMVLACAEAARDDDETRDLLVAGGELVWKAGPLVKGPSICHGAAGNALALLQLFDLTRDELWLDRARQLAMHGLEQVRRRRTEVGRGRYSLMTGDLGVATCLAQCESMQTGILGLDFL